MLTPVEIIESLNQIGCSLQIDGDRLLIEPGSLIPADLVPAIKDNKAGILALLRSEVPGSVQVATSNPSPFMDGPCTCDPLPSVKDIGFQAHALVGVTPCRTCTRAWQCRVCGGCRYCRTPG